ncbi:hypothetical protein SALBM311S_09404 [Streptomyces alboniger]
MANDRRLSWPRPSRRSWDVMFSMLASVDTRGCVPVCTAYCSAGRPKASKPSVCRTLWPVMRWKRAKTSVAM